MKSSGVWNFVMEGTPSHDMKHVDLLKLMLQLQKQFAGSRPGSVVSADWEQKLVDSL